jgi:hypothetical protein
MQRGLPATKIPVFNRAFASPAYIGSLNREFENK